MRYVCPIFQETAFVYGDHQNAAMISDALRQIRSILSNDPALAKIVPLIIKNRNQNDQARFENLLHYCLDFPTLKYLEQHEEGWLADPCAFDCKLKSSQQAFLSQGTRAVSRYLDTEQDNI